MNNPRILSWAAVLYLMPAVSSAHGFMNLDFEMATPRYLGVDASYQTAPAEDLFPHWQVLGGGVTVDWTFLEGGYTTLISPYVDTFRRGGPSLAYGLPSGPIEGYYSLYLQGRHGAWSAEGGDDLGWISQKGLVPIGTTTLEFYGGENGSEWFVDEFGSNPSLNVRLGGELLTLTEEPSGQPDISRFTADVSQWAGQTVALEFIARIPPVGFSEDAVWKGAALIDAIAFVPEPTTFSLLGLGSLIFVMLRRRC